ncbi:MAG: arsenate reductase ArsC [Acidobacteriaceae bacterium]
MTKSRVLFLCVGNTCRSQMAEAIVNACLAESWEAFSAGSRPEEAVNPLALQALEEIGITHHGKPKSVGEFHGVAFALVVILCASDDEQCPVWLGRDRVVQHAYPDPARWQGDQANKLIAYRAVRDQMLKEIPELLAGC